MWWPVFWNLSSFPAIFALFYFFTPVLTGDFSRKSGCQQVHLPPFSCPVLWETFQRHQQPLILPSPWCSTPFSSFVIFFLFITLYGLPDRLSPYNDKFFHYCYYALSSDLDCVVRLYFKISENLMHLIFENRFGYTIFKNAQILLSWFTVNHLSHPGIIISLLLSSFSHQC